MLCVCVTRSCGDHSSLTTAAILEWRSFPADAWNDPRLGACAHDRAHGHLSANAALIVPPRQPHAAEWRPPDEDPPGTHSGRRACVVLGRASEPPDLHPAEPQPKVREKVAPGRVAASARQI